MKDILDLQKRNFIENGHPSLEQRLDRLKRCVALIETHDDQIIESLNACLLYTSPSPRDS